MKRIFEKKEVKKEKKPKPEEEFGISGEWKCMYCGLVFESIIHPYLKNVPDSCIDKTCMNKYGRFGFIKWRIAK
ncbi:hypothetical protein LCGC14_0471560 [marine sediment metagenome]|uniref:Uncharacterized protein n=1 Tax=marine sediment metagenome TaxID=412755 RepID=A0A0F9SHA3_9ZZZZ|nr:MAG: hypothetical protein Lokiarch_25450 [Candidatus Lokiarchaeum sp. GC14_75]